MKKIFTLLALMVFVLSLYAAPVSQETAKKIAVSFYKHVATKTADYSVSNVVANQFNGLTTFYVFNFASGGYVMVSADDAVTPILGYSETDFYDQSNLPLNASTWFENYSREIEYIVSSNQDNTQTKKEWKDIENGKFNSTKAIVTPLCSTTWNQDGYYNDVVEANTESGVYVGCVATAMAQIMKKWNYPTTGTGSHTYTDATYGSLTANFGSTTYNWASMPNNVSSPNNAVATLSYHCGVSVNMSYGTDGSGAYSWDVPYALINYFNYSTSAEIQFKENFTSANWINMLKTELDYGRPVYYSGDDGSSGHAFVCDGYNSSNQFHFNWGWSGYSNGYFTIGSLNPTGYSFNLNNMAVIRITPPLGQPIVNFKASTTTPAVGASVDFTDESTNSPTSWSWTFDGGSPSTSTDQNPTTITYAAAGLYQVTLTASNANGTDTRTKVEYINVGGTPSAWILQNSGFSTASRGISCIDIVNPFVVWAGAVDGTSSTNYIQEFTRTTNGGITWTPGTITFTGSTTFGIANLCAFNDTVCYAAMFPGAAATGGYVAKTTDGGATWSIANSPNYSTSWLDIVYFFDVNNGVAIGDPAGTDYVIYTTSNGGTSWTQVSATSLPNCTTGETAITNLFDAFENNIWFGTTKGRIYKSTDKGLTWTVATTGFGTAAVVNPVFKDANNGIATATNNSTGAYLGLKKTTNGGTTWTAVTPTGYYLKNPNIDFVPGTSAMYVDAVSYPGNGSSYSLDDCTSWIDIDSSSTVQYTCVTFYNINTGWAGGFNESATNGGIYKWNPDLLVGLDNINNTLTNVSVFPNPANDFMNIEFTEFWGETASINIYNVVGELVFSETLNPQFNDVIKIDLSSLKSGIYMVKINDGEKIFSQKVSVIK